MKHPAKTRPFGSRKGISGTLPYKKGNNHRLKAYSLPRDGVEDFTNTVLQKLA